jgi:ABC-type nitrate/sulfonate/bicarbonate transport system substrate-binding protein
MKIPRRAFIGLIGAAALCRPALAADKIIGGTLGGQAPLWPFYVAARKGFFAAEDLDVEINFAQSAPAVAQQLTGGAFDVALSLGNDSAMQAIDKGAPLAFVRIIGNTAPYALIAKPGLKTIADLKGKTISVGQVNDITTLYFERMAAANGLKRSDYDEFVAGVAAARFAALKAGVADAAFVPFTGMVVRKSWAAANVSPLKRLLTATDNAIAWLADEAHRGEAIDVLVSAAHAKPEDAEASYDLLQRVQYFEPSSKVSRKKLQNLIDAERSLGMVDASLTVERLLMLGVTELTD